MRQLNIGHKIVQYCSINDSFPRARIDPVERVTDSSDESFTPLSVARIETKVQELD
jgi:hypothetical protein